MNYPYATHTRQLYGTRLATLIQNTRRAALHLNGVPYPRLPHFPLLQDRADISTRTFYSCIFSHPVKLTYTPFTR